MDEFLAYRREFLLPDKSESFLSYELLKSSFERLFSEVEFWEVLQKCKVRRFFNDGAF